MNSILRRTSEPRLYPPELPAGLKVQALAPTPKQAAQARADVEAEALADALIDAQDAHFQLQARFTDLRSMMPATASLLFGDEAAWRLALARVAVATGRALSVVVRLESRMPGALKIEQLAKPLDSNTRVQWTGD